MKTFAALLVLCTLLAISLAEPTTDNFAPSTGVAG